MNDGGPDRDFEIIDDSPPRPDEMREFRLLLEQNRARRRFAAKMKRWVTWLTLGLSGLAAGSQLGLIDWVAGFFVHWRH